MNIYAIKIALRGISPMIWRRLRLSGDTTIAELHHIIQVSMGWDNDYLHCFHIHGKDYGIAYEGGLNFSDDPRTICIDDFGFEAGDRFTYTYNFNDNWLNDVRIEDVQPAAGKTGPLPFCVSGSRRHGADEIDEYEALVRVLDKIVNPDTLTTVGDIRLLIEDYEAVRFNRQAINKCLSGALSS